MRRGERPPRIAGFTQIEVLTAMLIIGLATPFLMGGVIGGLTQARHSQDRGTATAWLQGEIDFLRLRCYERLGPSDRKVTASTVAAGELPPPAGFAAGYVTLDAAGPALLRATVSLYRRDWMSPKPTDPAYLSTSTFIGDIRVAGRCP